LTIPLYIYNLYLQIMDMSLSSLS